MNQRNFRDELADLILESVRRAHVDPLIMSSSKRGPWKQALNAIGGAVHKSPWHGGPSNFDLAAMRFGDHDRSQRLYELLQETGPSSLLHNQRVLLGETVETETAYVVNVIDTGPDFLASETLRELIAIDADVIRRSAWVSASFEVPVINVFRETADELLRDEASRQTLSVIRHEYIHTQRELYTHRGDTFGTLFNESLATLLSGRSDSYPYAIALLEAVHLVTGFDASSELMHAAYSSEQPINFFRNLAEATGPSEFVLLMSMKPIDVTPFIYFKEFGPTASVQSQLLGQLTVREMKRLGPEAFRDGFAERLEGIGDRSQSISDDTQTARIVEEMIRSMNTRPPSIGLE